jgi:hypothetical protein
MDTEAQNTEAVAQQAPAREPYLIPTSSQGCVRLTYAFMMEVLCLFAIITGSFCQSDAANKRADWLIIFGVFALVWLAFTVVRHHSNTINPSGWLVRVFDVVSWFVMAWILYGFALVVSEPTPPSSTCHDRFDIVFTCIVSIATGMTIFICVFNFITAY